MIQYPLPSVRVRLFHAGFQFNPTCWGRSFFISQKL